MKGEFDFAGIYLSTVVATAILAFVALFVLRKILLRIGVYRIVWHPALFDAALFVILWAAVSALKIGI